MRAFDPPGCFDFPSTNGRRIMFSWSIIVLPRSIARIVAARKTSGMLVAGPQSGRGELQEMAVRIAEIDAVAAARPLSPAFALDAGCAQPFLPSRQLVGRHGKGHVGWPLAVVGRNGAARQS